MPLSAGSPVRRGAWTGYTLSQPAQDFALEIKQTQQPTQRTEMQMDPLWTGGKPSCPPPHPSPVFNQAAVWKLAAPSTEIKGISQVLLRIRYTGDVARLTRDGQVVDDDFCNGLPWEVGFSPQDFQAREFVLQLKVLPMPQTAPIYLDSAARTLLQGAHSNPSLLSADLVPEYEFSVLSDKMPVQPVEQC